MPLPETPNLVKHCDYLYERTAGCIGILRDWFAEAYSLALDEPKIATLTLNHLEQNVPFSSERAFKMLKRITNAEKEFLNEFRDEVGSDPHINKIGNESTEATVSEEQLQNPSRRSGRVGERTPMRDKNGTGTRDDE